MGFRTNALIELTDRFARINHTGRLGESFSKIAGAVRSLEQLNLARDLTMPEAHHAAKVGRAAQQLQQRLPAIRETAYTEWTREQGRIAGLIVERCNLKPNRFETEIRAVLLAMPTLADRLAWLQETAKDDSNGPILAAVAEAPPALTGVTREALKAIEDGFIARLCPDLVAEREGMDTALATIDAAHRTAEKMAREYQNPAELARIAQAEEEAKNAQARMAEALA